MYTRSQKGEDESSVCVSVLRHFRANFGPKIQNMCFKRWLSFSIDFFSSSFFLSFSCFHQKWKQITLPPPFPPLIILPLSLSSSLIHTPKTRAKCKESLR